MDAARLAGGPYHLLFLDPPYRSGLAQRALDALAASGAMAPGALISLETAIQEDVDAPGLELEAERVHGKAKLRLFRAPA